MTVSVEDLTGVGNVVDPGYVHVTKKIAPGVPLALPRTFLKWYDLCRPDQAIGAEADTRAREFIRAETAAGRLPIDGDLGFVIHHLSGEHIHLLLVFTWRGNNEMWESTFARDDRAETPYEPISTDSHRGVMCVWEYGAVAHEHLAWTAYLRSARDGAAKRAYAETQYEGPI
jgi:hypothetical protein